MHSQQKLRSHELDCLSAIQLKLQLAFATPKPFKAVFLEYVLGGNGAQLSRFFLKHFARLCLHFNVVIIADEILTGGRVGPTVAMTTCKEHVPKEFADLVVVVTLGKFMGKGVVLVKVNTTLPSFGGKLRGTSTEDDTSKACKKLHDVMEKLGDERTMATVRDRTLKQLVARGEDSHESTWGPPMGLLIFAKHALAKVHKGMKCRVLPMLEAAANFKKGSRYSSQWTRSRVTSWMIETSRDWIRFNLHQHQANHPLLMPMLFHAQNLSCSLGRNVVTFRFSDFVEASKKFGSHDSLLEAGRKLKALTNKTGKCKASLVRLASEAFKEGSDNWRGNLCGTQLVDALSSGVRKKKARLTMGMVNTEELSVPIEHSAHYLEFCSRAD